MGFLETVLIYFLETHVGPMQSPTASQRDEVGKKIVMCLLHGSLLWQSYACLLPQNPPELERVAENACKDMDRWYCVWSFSVRCNLCYICEIFGSNRNHACLQRSSADRLAKS